MINDEIIKIKDKLRVFDMFNFEDEPHIYWWLDENGNRKQATTSMTALIHSHAQPFNKEEVAPRTAKKMGLPVQEVLDMWDYTNALSVVKGTHLMNISGKAKNIHTLKIKLLSSLGMMC